MGGLFWGRQFLPRDVSGDRLWGGDGLVGTGLGLACAGPGLRSQEGAGRLGFSRCARGAWGVCLQCSLRPDPAGAVGVRGGYLRVGTGCWGQALMGELFWGRQFLPRDASGDRLWGGDGLVGTGLGLACAGPGLRSQEGAGGYGFSRCARGDWGVCLQCSLRLDPAGAVGVRGGYLRVGTGCWGREVAPRDRLWWFRSSAALHSLWLTDGRLSNGGSIREFHWQTRGPVPDTSE
jgi:hypothetical protein